MAELSKINDIRDFQKFFATIYPNESLTEDYIFAYLSRSISYLCKNLSQKIDSTNSYIESISWIISLANKFEIDLQESLLRRYPGVCHYCISRPCKCHKTNKQPGIKIPLYKVAEELEAKYRSMATVGSVTLDWMSQQIDAIYQNNDILWTNAGPWKHLMKMQEEIGEIHEAYTGYLQGRKKKSALANEFADALGWLLGAWQITHRGVSLNDAIIDYYIKGCPVCSRDVCVCEPRAGRSKELLDELKLDEIRQQLKNLSESYPSFGELFSELDSSFETAISSQDEGIRRQVVAKTRDKLAEVFDKTGSVSKNANALYKTVETISAFFGV